MAGRRRRRPASSTPAAPHPTAPLVSADDLDQVGGGALTKDIGKLLPIADKPYRVQVTALDEPPGHYLVVGVRRDHRDEALRELLLQLTLAGLGALAVAAVVGDVLARAALRPVERYRRRAAEIADGADGLRLDVPEGRDDEVTRLGHTLNDMLAALERSLERERRFVNEASHELRTPLTLLKSRIQLAQRRSRTVEEHEAVLDELAVDVDPTHRARRPAPRPRLRRGRPGRARPTSTPAARRSEDAYAPPNVTTAAPEKKSPWST